MKTATVRELKSKLSQYLKEAEKEDIIVTSHGKPRAVLHSLVREELEDYIVSNSPTIRRKIEEAYSEYLSEGGVELDSVIEKLEKKVAKKARR
ncbi:MAG: type II toxin-antitoxin system Phd/YefM family antitoxin [Nitrospirota bacterium]